MAPAFKLTNVDDDAAPGSLSKSFIKANVETLADILTQAGKISRGIRNNCTNFYVYCFYLDFNGIEFGTVQDVSIFKPYKREINIQNLQAYPAQFAPLEKWFKNGEKLIDATKVSHLQYEGLTAGPNRKEINSPVVIDVKMAYEGGYDMDKAFIDVPEFKSLASLWKINLRS